MAYVDPYDATWRREQERKFAAWQKTRATSAIAPLYGPIRRRDVWCAAVLLGALAISIATLLHLV
jgi:hypothetical protein